MLAFFDSLIQRERESLHSDSEDSFLDDFHLSFILQPDSSEESDSDTTGTSMNNLLMRELLHRPSPGSSEGQAATNSSGQGVLRRLRQLRDTAVIRDLLNADSSSSDNEEETHAKVVVPELPRDLESGQDTAHSPVQFKRHQPHTKRHYRSQNRSRNDTHDSSSSESTSDSDSSQQKIKTKSAKDISNVEDSNSSCGGSSSDSEEDCNISKVTKGKTKSSSDEAETCKLSQKSKRNVQDTNSQNPSNSLKTHENVYKANEGNTNGFTETCKLFDDDSARDNHNENNISQGEGKMNSDRDVSPKTPCCSDLHENNHKVTSDGSRWTEQSDHDQCDNNKNYNGQQDDGKESNR